MSRVGLNFGGARPVRKWAPRHRHGPEKPIVTPPGARTRATVTPSITRVGGWIASAPSRSAASTESAAATPD